MKEKNLKISYSHCRGCGKRILLSYFKYCPDCSKISHRLVHELIPAKARESLWAYLRRYGSRCYFSGMSLEIDDNTSPWFLVFSRLIPGDKSKIVPASALIAVMKGRLLENELRYYVLALDDLRKKHLKVKKIPLVHWLTLDVPKGEKVCTGCRHAAVVKGRKFCPRCSKISFRMNKARFPREAINGVWEYIRKYGFVCYYTGMTLNLEDPKSPWYLVFDHWMPRDPRKIVITSALVNKMKSDLTEDEFWYFIHQLANFYRYGTVVRKKKLAFWSRQYR